MVEMVHPSLALLQNRNFIRLLHDLKTENSQKDDSYVQNCMLNVVGLLLSKFALLMLQIFIACFD